MSIPAYIYAFAAGVLFGAAAVWFLVDLIGRQQQTSMDGY